MGLDVDIRTGRTKEEIRNRQEAKKAEEQKSLENLMAKGMVMEDKLKSEEGRFFIDLIIKMLETRIDQLVQGDVQAQTILNVLGGFGQEITAGRYAAERLARIKLKIGE